VYRGTEPMGLPRPVMGLIYFDLLYLIVVTSSEQQSMSVQRKITRIQNEVHFTAVFQV
jgi:hypothetical protein